MRRSTCVMAGLLVLALARPGRSADADSPQAVIDKALKASGGRDVLEKYKGQTWKEKGNYHGMGNAQAYTGTFAFQWPDKYKMDIEGAFTIVVDGNKGWVTAGGQTMEMSKEQLANTREDLYAERVISLVPLKDKAYKLAPLGEMKIGEHMAVGVKVAREGHKVVNLWFDKDSGLLVKSETTTKAEEQGGKEVNQESVYSDYKEIKGMKIASKTVIKRDGKLYVEAENYDIEPQESLPAATFAKPG